MVRKNAKILIEQALIELLQDNPLDSIDVQDIAAAAGLSRQTFYYNFNNKHDLLCWILEQDTSASSFRLRLRLLLSILYRHTLGDLSVRCPGSRALLAQMQSYVHLNAV